jgi:hypothetical protein
MRQSISTKARSALALLYDFERTEIASRTNSSLNAVSGGKSFTRLRFMPPLLAKAARENHNEEMGVERN